MEKIKIINSNDLDLIDVILEEKQPKKYRNWCFVLYEDSTSYDFVNVMRILKSHKKWAYIKHSPEENEKRTLSFYS